MLRSGGNGSIESQNLGLAESYQLGIPSSISLFTSVLFCIMYYFIGSPPGINGVCRGFTTSRSQSIGGGVALCAGSTERSP